MISLSEKLKATYESLTFLQRCKRNYLVPDCVSHCFDISLKIKKSASLDQLLTKSKRNLLSILIRSKYSEINDINRCLKERKLKLSDRTRTQLMPIISVAEKETQERSERTAFNKFNKLKNVRRTARRNTPKVSCSTPDNCKTTDNTADRVTVIGDIKVTKPALQALAKGLGPKFASSPHFSCEKLQHTVQTEVAALAYAMRWQSAYSLPAKNKQSTSTAVTEQTLPACPFHSDRKDPPRDNPMIEKKIQNIQKDIQRIMERCDVHVNSNLPLTEQTAIKELSKQENITITSDKGREMVVMKALHLEKLRLEHRRDTTTYEKLKKDPSDALRLKVNKTWKHILTKHDFSTTFINNLQTPITARRQHFYGLPKTQDQPEDSANSIGLRSNLCNWSPWLVSTAVAEPLLNHVKAHLNSTTDLLARFNAIEESKLSGTIPISFQVFCQKSQVKKKRTRPMSSAVFNPTWARFPQWKDLSFNETVRGRWTKRLLNEGGMRRREEKTTTKAFLPLTGLQSFQDNILKAVVGNCIAVRAVSSYQWASPRSRRTFRHESMKAGKRGARKAGRKTLP